ncbi:Imm42 family immunity protein [Nocardia macrotermitis]|uniref:Uncharacterized protein n=1 Tax=Nocardia macrotermitis TaxID=2585198 RepID=A0A7K0CY34_9NOCA|nr:Imm42 family immunity protein [Nocardia macrotermitis]MQY18353.1 hypothetical protein [Nocardia macrotermitis]
MLVGDRARFAVEYELEPVRAGDAELARWMFGRIRWWCGGDAVGRFDRHGTVREVAVIAQRLLDQGGGRCAEGLLNVPAAEVVRVVTEALFGSGERSDAQIVADGARYWPLFVSPRTEVFDAWDVVVVEGATRARLIWGLVGHPEISECELSPGEFDDVLRAFLGTLHWGGR